MAVVLAVLRILTDLGWKGKYAIEGQAFAGEEGGLLGSSKLAASYKAAGKTVRGMLMVEMIGMCKRVKNHVVPGVMFSL